MYGLEPSSLVFQDISITKRETCSFSVSLPPFLPPRGLRFCSQRPQLGDCLPKLPPVLPGSHYHVCIGEQGNHLVQGQSVKGTQPWKASLSFAPTPSSVPASKSLGSFPTITPGSGDLKPSSGLFVHPNCAWIHTQAFMVL